MKVRVKVKPPMWIRNSYVVWLTPILLAFLLVVGLNAAIMIYLGWFTK